MFRTATDCIVVESRILNHAGRRFFLSITGKGSALFTVERGCDHLIDRVDKNKIHLFSQILGHVLEIVLIFFRQDYSIYSCPFGGENFLLYPPIGMTLPRSVISPVMAMSCFATFPLSIDTIAVVMVTPADGPSLGIAPAGTWI